MKTLFTIALLLLTASGAISKEACTIVADANSGTVLYQAGTECESAFSPASTFKIALAVMGFDSGLLASPTAPAELYDPATDAYFEVWRQTTTPQSWLQYSVIWYSQLLTQRMGMDQFQTYVDAFAYGNRDLSGDPGKANGLTHAWLSSSLKITPNDQIRFLRDILNARLPVSLEAIGNVKRTVQAFDAPGGWLIHGKTGNAWQLNPDGTRSKRQNGWFIGWAEKGDQLIVFVRLNKETEQQKGFASSRTKASFIENLNTLVP